MEEKNNRKSNIQGGRVLASISYFSVFFAPIIMPVIIWIFADKPTSVHAIKALTYHIFMYVAPIVLVLITSILGNQYLNIQNQLLNIAVYVSAIAIVVLIIWYMIKNLYRGVKVLISEDSYFYP
jgi:hypothetical protein